MRTLENIPTVAESVREAPLTSIHRRPQELNISETSLTLILYKDLGMTPYKVQLDQELKPIDHPMRFRLAKWKKNHLSTQAHFDVGVYINKQNCRICGTENPYNWAIFLRK